MIDYGKRQSTKIACIMDQDENKKTKCFGCNKKTKSLKSKNFECEGCGYSKMLGDIYQFKGVDKK